MYVHANFQDTTAYTKKVTRVEVELFDQPSYEHNGLVWINIQKAIGVLLIHP